jgi:predicted dehydrogenase
MKRVEGIDIAAQSSLPVEPSNKEHFTKIYDSYETALKESRADLVYISIVNNLHAEWTEKALKAGYHVIVDKPAVTSLEDACRLVDLSKKLNLCLAEACVYCLHPQIEFIRNTIRKLKSIPACLVVNFSFPPLPENNFRYRKELGGGALWDLGAYAVTPGRIFFGDNPIEIICRIGSRHSETKVDTSFSTLVHYSEGRSMIGHFGFNTEYRNRLSLLGPDFAVDVDRIFTTPSDMQNAVVIMRQNKTEIEKAPAGDSFLYFIQDVMDRIDGSEYSICSENLLADATSLIAMRKSAGEE